MIDSVEGVEALLRRWRNFEECLLHEIRFSNGLYIADVTFNYVWDANGQVRSHILEDPEFVTLKLVGVESFRFTGALTKGMRDAPERINWGLSEIATVRALDKDEFIGLSVQWESQRGLEARFMSLDLIESKRTNE